MGIAILAHCAFYSHAISMQFITSEIHRYLTNKVLFPKEGSMLHRAAFLRQKTESDGESVEETCSEEEDDLLSNYGNQDDVFDAGDEDVSYSCDDEDGEEINFNLGKNWETIWSDKPLKSKFSKTP
uniref:Uncharacterized protein n=1 Tax=Rhodnius prolixus TaxID=13249 RepID=T1ICK2_RHOPR